MLAPDIIRFLRGLRARKSKPSRSAFAALVVTVAAWPPLLAGHRRMRKAIGDMPPRLQRFFLRLLRYDIKLQFTPGKQLLLADMLSRATTATSAENDVTNDDTEVHAINSTGIRTITWRGTSRKKTADNVARRPAVSK